MISRLAMEKAEPQKSMNIGLPTMCKQLWRGLTVVAAIGEEGETREPKPAMEKSILFVCYRLLVVSPQEKLCKIVIILIII